MKSSAEIYEFLLCRLRHVIRRSGMHGGESAILNLMDYITFVDERKDEWKRWRQELTSRQAINARGVLGAFEQILGRHQHESYNERVGAVYALIAFRMGYLDGEQDDGLQRLLNPAEYESMLDQTNEMMELENCTPETVTHRFGVPSMRFGTNDNYPCTLLYLPQAKVSGYIYFDFVAEWAQDENGIRKSGKHGPKPLLGNIRIPAKPFPEEFVFTSLGRRVYRTKI